MSQTLAMSILVAGAVVLGGLLPFAMHRTLLLRASRRPRSPRFDSWLGPLPRVTVQLPVFNEWAVVERLIDAACRLDYPSELLDIQVLDDSTDESVDLAAARVAWWYARGVRIQHIRRPTRDGFKAGALAYGVAKSTAEFLLVLDADFVPQPGLVRKLVAPFMDEGVGMVQARWDHLNEEENALTRAQALLLDGHFFFEQGGRYAAHRFFNFNGTAGMWRRSCLVDAGGWQSDTLTEDLDLSYRAQMRGWRFEYLRDVGVPAELPSDVPSLEVQQKRWAQGGIQTARKVLPQLLAGPWSLGVKLEGAIHLLGHLAHPLTVLLALLLFPATLAREAIGLDRWIWLDTLLFLSATVPFVIFYLSAARLRGRPWLSSLVSVARTLALGVGLSAPVSIAVARGILGRKDPFRRTPKKGTDRTGGYRALGSSADIALKLGMSLWTGGSVVWAAAAGLWGSLPFLLLFACGYIWLTLASLGIGSAADPAHAVPKQQDEERHPDRSSHPGRFRPSPRGLKGVEAPVG